MIVKSSFLTELETRDIDDSNFCLTNPLVYQSKILNGMVTVPKGFVSDGSSTPRVPIVFLLYGNRAHREGVLHDYFYRAENHYVSLKSEDGISKFMFISKSLADSVFLEAMKSREKPFYVRYGMYLGVKFGGSSSWKTGFERFRIVE